MKYNKITVHKRLYVTLLRQKGKLSFHQTAIRCKISKSSFDSTGELRMKCKPSKIVVVDLQY